MSGQDLYEYFRSGEGLPSWEHLSSDIRAKWNDLVAETLEIYRKRAGDTSRVDTKEEPCSATST